MKKLLLMSFILGLAACAPSLQSTVVGPPGPTGPQGPTGPTAPTTTTTTPPVVDVVQEDIDALLQDENDYRLGLGQTALTSGLSCSVQQVLSGTKISASSPGGGTVIVTTGTLYTYLYKGLFNQPNATGQNNLIPSSLRPLFTSINYIIKCNGFIVVRETNYYNFKLNSDDGSILSVDGSVVVNNDNSHGMTVATGTKFLRRGVRPFSLTYSQTGGGNFGLILTAAEESIDPRLYAH